MTRVALAVLAGILLAGSLPVTMPVTATIFGLALANFAFNTGRRYNDASRSQELNALAPRNGRRGR